MEKAEIKKLVDKAKLDDQRAFGELYNYYYPQVNRLVRSIVKNTEDSEDISIEAITKAFKNIQKYREDLSFDLWLKKVTTNYIIDKIRSGVLNNKTVSMDDENTHEIFYTDFSNPEKDYIKTEVRALLEEEFDLISGRAKQMLDLRYKKDYTYQQIADELGISIGNVKNILNKTRTRITKKVNKNESNLSKGVENCKAVT